MFYPWILTAEKSIGLKEVPGKNHNPIILGWLKKLSAWWSEDETPWCGTFVAHCMRENSLRIPKDWMRAKAWIDWGVQLNSPVDGCVVVFERNGGGHVGFIYGRSEDNMLLVLGGNQGNMVNISKFDRNRVVGYYWPGDYPYPDSFNLTVKEIKSSVSTNEA